MTFLDCMRLAVFTRLATKIAAFQTPFESRGDNDRHLKSVGNRPGVDNRYLQSDMTADPARKGSGETVYFPPLEYRLVFIRKMVMLEVDFTRTQCSRATAIPRTR